MLLTALALLQMQAPPSDSCRTVPITPAVQALQRSWTAMGVDRTAGKVLHYAWIEGTENNFQSDRPYRPFFSVYTSGETWSDATTGLERLLTSSLYAGTGPTPARAALVGERAAYIVRDTLVRPSPLPHDFALQHWLLNPWNVVASWSKSQDVNPVGVCTSRDFPRLVYERPGPYGKERLFLDNRTFMPVKLDAIEPHFLWGQQHVEYIYSNWLDVDGAQFPIHAFRMTDGDVEITRSIGRMSLVAMDSAPSFKAPPAPPAKFDRFLETFATTPDTVRVADNTFMLRTMQYSHAVTLQRDTIFLFDATTDANRSAADSVWIGKLFPGRHPVVVVVTDLAWPHVGGLRYWVANGATVVSHRSSRPFIRAVVDRRWTRKPDLLEQRRKSTSLTFRAVDDQMNLAGGQVQLHRIAGIGSENALMAYVPSVRYLWASDYIQNVQRPTAYTREVWARVQELRLDPTAVSAQHIPLTPWSSISKLMGAGN